MADSASWAQSSGSSLAFYDGFVKIAKTVIETCFILLPTECYWDDGCKPKTFLCILAKMNTVLIRIPLDEVPVWLRILTVIVLAILVIIRIVLVIEQAKKVKSQKETDALVSHMNKNTNQIKKLSGEKEEPQSQDQEMIDQAFGKGANISGVSDEGSEEETEDNLDHYDKNKNIADLIDEISDTDASSSADITNIHKAFKHD